MGQHIVKQPNGKYAIFSSVVDDFIAYNATPEEIARHFRQQAIENSDRITARARTVADHFADARFATDIETVRRLHGTQVADAYEVILSAPDPQSLRAPQADPFPTIYCPCGNTWNQEMHTVCPHCGKWPAPRATEGKEGPKQ